jgi:hypothetical protein
MTLQRLQYLERALLAAGFQWVGPVAHAERYELDGDEIHWELISPRGRAVHLDMWANGPMGQYPTSANELFRATARGTGDVLFFNKISGPWPADVQTFIGTLLAHDAGAGPANTAGGSATTEKSVRRGKRRRGHP